MLVTSAALPEGGGCVVTSVNDGVVRLSGAATKTVEGAQFSVALNAIDLPSVAQTDAGTYKVVVSNSVPSAAESSIQLNVTKPVTIVSDPVDVRVRAAVDFSGSLTAGSSVVVVSSLEARGIVEGMVVKDASGGALLKADTKVLAVAAVQGGSVAITLDKTANLTASAASRVAGEIAVFRVDVDKTVSS